MQMKCADCGGTHEVTTNSAGLFVTPDKCPSITPPPQEGSHCAGCGVSHNRRNQCDNTFSAFCTDKCHNAAMSS